MNTISGKVVLKESGVGIPGLLVAIYNVADGAQADKIRAQYISNRNNGNPASGARQALGSVLTNAAGEFALNCEMNEYPKKNESPKENARGEKRQRPSHRNTRTNLFLVVLAPEEKGKDFESRILYCSTDVRYNAGPCEQFLIQLTDEQLKKAGIPNPVTNNPALQDSAAVINQLKESEKNQAQLREGLRGLHRQRLAKVRATTQIFKDTVQPQLLATLSSIPPGLTNSDTYVVGGREVTAKSFKLIKKGIENVVNVSNDPKIRVPFSGRIRLTQEQITALRSRYGTPSGDLASVPEDEIEPILFDNTSLHRTNVLLRENPFSRICRDKSNGEKCLDNEPHEDDDHGEEDTPGPIILAPGPGIEVVTKEDVPRFIAKLLDKMTSPEEAVSFGEVETGKRADQNDVQRRIDALSFRKSPADVPAFYDFHSLQIAFEYVWQEALDQGILDLAADAYKTIVELGGTPSTEPLGASSGNALDLIKAFRFESLEIKQALSEDPTVNVVQAINITREQWSVLNLDLRRQLENIASEIINWVSLTKLDELFGLDPKLWEQKLRIFIEHGKRIIRYADSLLAANSSAGDSDALNHLHKILQELEQRITGEPYGFTIFGANRQERSVNFGILTTYRQKWDPVSYQAGELAKTITLAPKETRKFSKKTVVKRSRAIKEAETNQSTRKEEFNKTSRAEAEIMRNAQAKTNFSLTTTGSVKASYGDIVGGEATHSIQFGGDASQTSNEVKKEFREAVFKAAQEYRDERKLEISTEESFEQEFVESGEITNPNDELTVTFLFYELQRRYRVSEHIHRILPVVFVAQEVPAPHEIDEEWLIAYDWILRRFLLDDSFLPALNYLCTRIVGDEVALKEMSKNVELQRKLVAELKEEIMVYRRMSGQRYAALEEEIASSARAAEDEGGGRGGVLGDIGAFALGGTGGLLLKKGTDFLFGDDKSPEAARIRERAARDAYEKAEQEERDFLGRLNQEVSALNAITQAYTKALSEHLNQKTQIARLRVHVKQNILYYMQGIWLMEPPDQRFFRLHEVKVPIFQKKAKSHYNIKARPTFNRIINADRFDSTDGVYDFTVEPQLDPEFATATLVEVADLDNLLGFKGNYAIFPLKKSNPLTDFMMAPYIDQEWGLYDPDTVGNMTLDEFSDYVCCLKKKLSPEDFEAVKPELKELLKALLTTPLRDNEEIIVPTGSLFIEALAGVHPLLEDFKLMHRAIDVKKVQAEVRKMEMENIRYAARLLSEEREDPDIERKIVIEGSVNPNIDVDNP